MSQLRTSKGARQATDWLAAQQQKVVMMKAVVHTGAGYGVPPRLISDAEK